MILPASFFGRPRGMRKRYTDVITLVQKFGKPDIFLTMTCNPQWNEIENELYPRGEAQERPRLVVRIFTAEVE